LVLVALVAAALAATAMAASSRNVALSEFKVGLTKKSAAHGRVTFVVKNSGEFEHELVVVKTSRRASKLPVSGKEASEKGAGGEVEDVAAGKSKKLTLNLKKGHYVLICNIPGHYKSGMHADFTVS
jgi:uncharacterized cupredoxin-like copper-binding protein